MAFRFKWRWRYLRPFPSLHWTIPCVFVALLLVWTMGLPCQSIFDYGGPVLLTAIGATAFWVAVYSTVATHHGWRRWVKIGCSIVFDVLCLFLWALPFMLLQPHHMCSVERTQVMEMIFAASPYRVAIAERATQRQSLAAVGAGMSVEPTGRLQGGAISPNGTITLFSDGPRALVVLRPYFENSELKWACEGFPLRAMPAQCRKLPYQTPEIPQAN